MTCYFQGCTAKAVSKEHIPPKAFFPSDEREQLLTVRACDAHNSAKSNDDFYVLAHICINASPSNRAREVFMTRVVPQLDHNGGRVGRLLARCAEAGEGGVAYPVDVRRFNEFFTALACGLVFRSQRAQLPQHFRIHHIYHQLGQPGEARPPIEFLIEEFYAGKPEALMNFGTPETRNERIYTAQIFGLPRFQSSITITHTFFGVFKVTSMLSLVGVALLDRKAAG
jgi:hypothetical protein